MNAVLEVLPMTQILPPRKWSKELKALSIRVPVDLAAELERLAEKHGYSINELMNYIVDWGVAKIIADDQEREAAREEAKPKKK